MVQCIQNDFLTQIPDIFHVFYFVRTDLDHFDEYKTETRHGISNNVVFATSKVSDQPALKRNLIRAFACRLNIL